MLFNVKSAFAKALLILYPTKSFHFTLLRASGASLAQVFLKEMPQSASKVTDQLRCASTMLAEVVVSLLTLQTFFFHSSMFEIFHFVLFHLFFFKGMVVFVTQSPLYVPATDLHNKLHLPSAVSVPISQPAPTAAEPNDRVVCFLILELVCPVRWCLYFKL